MRMIQLLTIGCFLGGLVAGCQPSTQQTSSENDTTNISWSKEFMYDVTLSEIRNKDGVRNPYQIRDWVKSLLDSVKNGHIEAYSVLQDSLLSPAQVDSVFRQKQVKTVMDTAGNVQKSDTVWAKLTVGKVRQLRFKEVWKFDKQGNLIQKDVKAIMPMWSKTDDQGNLVVDLPTFWIHVTEGDIPTFRKKEES